MCDDKIKERIESSAGLRRVRATLIDEVSFRADDSIRLDPLTILTIISIIIQVISYCRENQTDENIINLIRSSRTIPRRKTIRLRRRLNNFAAANGISDDNVQVIYNAIMDMGENATDEEINEIVQIAREC